MRRVAYIFLYLLKGFFKIFIWVLLVMIVVAMVDYTYQKWQYEKDLRMTKQEVKEEHKEIRGGSPGKIENPKHPDPGGPKADDAGGSQCRRGGDQPDPSGRGHPV